MLPGLESVSIPGNTLPDHFKRYHGDNKEFNYIIIGWVNNKV